MKTTLSSERLSELGLAYDQEAQALFGTYEGYPLALEETYAGEYTLTLAVKQGEQAPKKTVLQGMTGDSAKAIVLVTTEDYQLDILLKADSKGDAADAQLTGLIREVIAYLKAEDWVPCCQETGQTEGLGVYSFNGFLKILAPSAYAQHRAAIEAKLRRPERVWRGLLGAVLGGLTASALTLLLGHQGYVIWFMGFVIGLAVLIGYRLLAGKFSVKAVLICLPVLAVFLFLLNEADSALFLLRGQSLGNIWKFFTEVRWQVSLMTGLYWESLMALSLTAVAGYTAAALLLGLASRRQSSIRRLTAEGDQPASS